MNKVVISGSASLQKETMKWKEYWENNNCEILDYPKVIDRENFLEIYSKVHTGFFVNMAKTDILFIMNEDKNNVSGYIGAETFAELAFGVAQKVVYNKDIKVQIMKMPEINVQCYEEIKLWLSLGWIELFEK